MRPPDGLRRFAAAERLERRVYNVGFADGSAFDLDRYQRRAARGRGA
jgi:hypothetical protein